MTFTTATTPPALKAYRSRHVVEPVRDWQDDFRTFVMVCRVDAIRVHEVRGGWRHDPSEIRELAARERGEGVQW